jgi:hypothetical protein
MFLGRQMVHQQVDLAFSQFPKGLAAELACDQAPPTRLAFAARINHRPSYPGDHAKWGLTSITQLPKRSPKSAAAPRQIPGALANKGLGDELIKTATNQ